MRQRFSLLRLSAEQRLLYACLQTDLACLNAVPGSDPEVSQAADEIRARIAALEEAGMAGDVSVKLGRVLALVLAPVLFAAGCC